LKEITELFVERANRILALGYFGRIVLDSYERSTHKQNPELNKLFAEASSKLPEHYAKRDRIDDDHYRVVTFADSLCLISLISEAEAFFQDAMKIILQKHPKKISAIGIDLGKILDLNNIDKVKEFAAQIYITSIMYKRPNEYKKELLSLISADEKMLDNYWPAYVEAKARRDIGVHNSWIKNDTYRDKIREVGVKDTEGEELSIDYRYFQTARQNIINIMESIQKHCEKKFGGN
jgi:hypothetical protein